MGIEISEEQGAYLMTKIRARCTEDGDCLMWPGSANSNGIPSIRVGKTVISVRKLVLMEAGRWKDGLNAANTCGRYRCVAEGHSAALNRRELSVLSAERTKYHLRPERNAKIAAYARKGSKLECAEMREAILNSDLSTRAEARLRGVSQHAVCDLRGGRSFKQYSSPFAGLGAR